MFLPLLVLFQITFNINILLYRWLLCLQIYLFQDDDHISEAELKRIIELHTNK